MEIIERVAMLWKIKTKQRKSTKCRSGRGRIDAVNRSKKFFPSSLALIYFYRVLTSFNEFYQVLSSFIEFYRVLSSFTEFYRVLGGWSAHKDASFVTGEELGLNGLRVEPFTIDGDVRRTAGRNQPEGADGQKLHERHPPVFAVAQRQQELHHLHLRHRSCGAATSEQQSIHLRVENQFVCIRIWVVHVPRWRSRLGPLWMN